MKFQTLRLLGLTLILSTTIAAKSPEESAHGFRSNNILPKTQNSTKFNFVGEIVKHSYIKLKLESILDINSKQELMSLKGTCYEAISGNEYRVIGSYNVKTLTWKLNCFDKHNAHASVFVGKETTDGNIAGKWTKKKTVRNFYLKKAD